MGWYRAFHRRHRLDMGFLPTRRHRHCILRRRTLTSRQLACARNAQRIAHDRPNPCLDTPQLSQCGWSRGNARVTRVGNVKIRILTANASVYVLHAASMEQCSCPTCKKLPFHSWTPMVPKVTKKSPTAIKTNCSSDHEHFQSLLLLNQATTAKSTAAQTHLLAVVFTCSWGSAIKIVVTRRFSPGNREIERIGRSRRNVRKMRAPV